MRLPIMGLILMMGNALVGCDGGGGGGENTSPSIPPTVPYQSLNDTGITWGSNYPDGGKNTGCIGETIAEQDCAHGRDSTDNDNSDGHAGFSFTKLGANGEDLSATSVSWSCVRDNVTGLVWENKTNDGSIHDRDNTYPWGGKTALPGGGYGYLPDWDVLVDGSNSESLCGYNDWRVPHVKELEGISDLDGRTPAIDLDYFPNTVASFYWTSVPDARTSGPSASLARLAWSVYFGNDRPPGTGLLENVRMRVHFNYVRLVRGGS